MRLLSFFALILLMPSCKTKVDQTNEPSQTEVFQTQVIPGELPDPSIIEVDGIFYATGSSNDWGPLYPIYESSDLKNWRFVNYVFKEIPEWTSSSFWAPELVYRDGKFYCYYTAKRKDGVSVIGVASTEDISSGFEDHGQLLEWGNESIDAFVFQEGNELYVSWKAYGLNPDKPIQLLGAALSEDGLQLKGEVFEILTAESGNWENGGIEGQSIVEKDGYLYLLYSGNACCGALCDYMVGVARAKSFQGPWEKYTGNPILTGNQNWKCPGHGTAIQSGDDWYYLYHAYPTAGFPYLGRAAVLSQFFWNEADAWPYFKVNDQSSQPSHLKKDFKDEFDSEKLGAIWRFDIPNNGQEVSTDSGKLVIVDKNRGSSNPTGAFIGVNPEAADFTMEAAVLTTSDALSGIALYATKENSVGLGMENGVLVLWKVKGGSLEILHESNLGQEDSVRLRATVEEGYRLNFEYSLDGKAWNPVTNSQNGASEVLADHLDFWSWGIKAGLFVRGAEKSQGEFENFQLTY